MVDTSYKLGDVSSIPSRLSNVSEVSHARWLTEAEQAAWRGMLRMHSWLTAELGHRMVEESALSYADYQVLVVLTDEAEGHRRLFEIADMLGWEKSRVSHQVARMVDRGLVEKVPCDTDRRGFLVIATAKGRKAIESAAPCHVTAVRELFVDRLTPAQLEAITGVAADVLRLSDDA
jgi:DNA-binding MarR family transcriptional regulator